MNVPRCLAAIMMFLLLASSAGHAQVPMPFSAWTNRCNTPWGSLLDDGGTATAFLATSACPSCTSETRTCTSGSLSGSYTNASCSVSCASCNLPWGGSISHGQSVTAWNTSSSCGGCSPQTRTCSNGSLSGSFTFSSCTTSCASCSSPWGSSIAHGQSVTAYLYAITYSCASFSQTRTCSNGSLSGSYGYGSCDQTDLSGQ